MATVPADPRAATWSVGKDDGLEGSAAHPPEGAPAGDRVKSSLPL